MHLHMCAWDGTCSGSHFASCEVTFLEQGIPLWTARRYLPVPHRQGTLKKQNTGCGVVCPGGMNVCGDYNAA